MVSTRRSASYLSHDDESFSTISGEQEPLLTSISETRRPPPPPLPPPPPPPPPMPTALTAGMDANSSRHGFTSNRSGSRDDPNEDVQMDRTSTVGNEPEQPTTYYLQVRVAPTSIIRPSRIYRHHRHSQSSRTDSRLLHRRRQRDERVHGKDACCFPSVQGDIVRVLVPAEGFSSERQLSDCLRQAAAACDDFVINSFSAARDYLDIGDDGSWDSIEGYYADRGRLKSNIAGMFRESDSVFVPLSTIYSQPKAFVRDVLSIKRPTRLDITRHKPSGNSIFVTFVEVVGIIIASIASWLTYRASNGIDYWNFVTHKIGSLLLAFVNIPFYLFDLLIEFPLRELYRKGPSLVGWEGQSLAKICSRVTYHGDEEFWTRNIEECERIYASKEAAAMQIRKPILVGLFIMIIFYMVKYLVEARAMRRQRLDPNMVEMYRAITMLIRQVKRAIEA